MGDAIGTAPIRPVPGADFGIRINKPEPEVEHQLTPDDCMKLFGKRESVMMHFIPQMLTALALEQAEALIDYCRQHRLSEYKRHNREIRRCIDEHNFELRKAYGSAWNAYQYYLSKLRETVEIDIFKCYCTFLNEAERQYVGKKHNEVPARVTLVRMMLTFVEDFDKNMDKVIAARMNKPCYRKQEPYCFLISVLCMDIAETFGYKMKLTDTMIRCIKVLANRCYSVADAIIADEEAEANVLS